jgi:hypothetical protein
MHYSGTLRFPNAQPEVRRQYVVAVSVSYFCFRVVTAEQIIRFIECISNQEALNEQSQS